MTFINKILNPITEFFSSSSQPKDNGPIYQTPNDVIALFFSFLRNKANLGSTCKWFNNIYLSTTPEALCRKNLITALEKPAEEFVNETFERKIYAKEDSSAQPKLNKFLTIFSETLKSMNLGPHQKYFEYSVLYSARIIKNCSIEPALIIKSHLPTAKYIAPATAIKAALGEFNNKIFHNMFDSYAKQPIEEITFDSFNKHTLLICGYFPQIPRDVIQDLLRDVILKEHGLQKLNAIYKEYLNPSADAPRFIAARSALEAKLSDKKTALITWLIDHQEPTIANNNNIETALRTREQMEVERNESFVAFLTACQESSFLGFINPGYLRVLITQRPWDDNDDYYRNTVQEFTKGLNQAKTSSAEQDAALAKIKGLLATSQQKYQNYVKQCKVYAYLATLHETEKDLKDLDTEVRNEMAIKAAFYSEFTKKAE
jgi:hypothetical protein